MKNLRFRGPIALAASILLLTGITGCEKDKEEPSIRVMTWNVYLGTDICAILLDTTIPILPGLPSKTLISPNGPNRWPQRLLESVHILLACRKYQLS